MSALFQQREWSSAVNTLRVKGAALEQVYNDLLKVRPPDNSQLLARYNALLERALVTKNSVIGTTNLIDNVYKAAQNTLDDQQLANLNGLGFLPLIPIAVITGSIAGVTYWINDAVQYLDKTERIEKLVQEGASSDAAYTQVYGKEFNIMEYVPWLIGGTVTLLLMPRVIKAYRLKGK